MERSYAPTLTSRRFTALHQRFDERLWVDRGISDGVLRKAGNFKVVASLEMDDFPADVAFAG